MLVQFVRSSPLVVLERDVPGRLVGVPGALVELKNLSEFVPIEQVIAFRQRCFITSAVKDDVEHVPFGSMSEHARAIDHLAWLALQHDSVFERSLDRFIDIGHDLGRHRIAGLFGRQLGARFRLAPCRTSAA